MKKIFTLFMVILCLCSCVGYLTLNNYNVNDSDTVCYDTAVIDTQVYYGIPSMTYGVSMKSEYEKKFSMKLFDSICKADNISNDLRRWYKTGFINGETGCLMYEYLYIKSNQITYRLIKCGTDSVKISKRVIY